MKYWRRSRRLGIEEVEILRETEQFVTLRHTHPFKGIYRERKKGAVATYWPTWEQAYEVHYQAAQVRVELAAKELRLASEALAEIEKMTKPVDTTN
jgi:hypothetical protein